MQQTWWEDAIMRHFEKQKEERFKAKVVEQKRKLLTIYDLLPVSANQVKKKRSKKK